MQIGKGSGDSSKSGDESGEEIGTEISSEEWIEGEPVVIPIEEAIDLHHFHPSEVLDIVDAYLDAAIERGFREVRLIHGRGKGVQRARVQSLLAADRRVLDFSDAPPMRGGWGASIVRLTPGPDTPRTGDNPPEG
jgi:dsDNA-specific endonuclease/ATPase MutS2